MFRIVKFVFLDILKNRIVLGYTLLLAVLTGTVFSLEESASKAMLTMMSVTLFTVPLVCVVFSTIYMYNSSEFIEVLVSQPLKRGAIWRSLFAGLGGSLALAFIVGCGIPMLYYHPGVAALILLATGSVISAVFAALAMLASSITRDKAKGTGISILLWLFFALLFDGVVLFLLFQFGDYPIEKPMVIVSALNPIDLARILMLLHLDASALMGYTGAIFRQMFGSGLGVTVSFGILTLWAIVPYLLSARKFRHADL